MSPVNSGTAGFWEEVVILDYMLITKYVNSIYISGELPCQEDCVGRIFYRFKNFFWGEGQGPEVLPLKIDLARLLQSP
jgi:hypothetical protein